MKYCVSMETEPVRGVFREVYDDCKGRQMDSLWGLPLCSCGPFLRKPLLKCTCVCLCVFVCVCVWRRGGLIWSMHVLPIPFLSFCFFVAQKHLLFQAFIPTSIVKLKVLTDKSTWRYKRFGVFSTLVVQQCNLIPFWPTEKHWMCLKDSLLHAYCLNGKETWNLKHLLAKFCIG